MAKRIKAALPAFIKPQLATLKMKAPSGVNWIQEIKYDGYRIQLHIDGDTRKAFTRNGQNWISKFSKIAGAFEIRRGGGGQTRRDPIRQARRKLPLGRPDRSNISLAQLSPTLGRPRCRI
ncbi:hypothetical protein [Bradyrhizobium sp. CB2312]|uniref:ATP-dependent DNA ligase n=1 Tax=Bradyrhizobium sp. CB2312 TaxID=3039155 RepID=UPI0024B14EC7|nr:hypothetical protein [Bradyrhizobium sp. CB2312]WFU72915.1 hypothetical protein QA642_02200 [Bradyrhizobium sp. CB2312]